MKKLNVDRCEYDTTSRFLYGIPGGGMVVIGLLFALQAGDVNRAPMLAHQTSFTQAAPISAGYSGAGFGFSEGREMLYSEPGHGMLFSSGAPAGHARSPKESSRACNACHGGTLTQGGSIAITTAASYKPGEPVTITVGGGVRGFQLTALDHNNNYVGSFSPSAGGNTRLAPAFESFAGANYVTHAQAGTASGTFTLQWNPPASTAGDGTVTFYAAGITNFSSTHWTTKTIAKAQTVSQIAVSTMTVSFGDVGVGRNSEKSVTVRNEASASANLTGTVGSGTGAFSVTSGGGAFTLSPGQSRTIRVRFAPGAVGQVQSTLAISHNGSNSGSPITIALQGNGVLPTATEVEPGLPGAYALYAGQPNPFTSQTTLRYDLPRPGKVTLKVFDISGHLVATLVEGTMAAGTYTANFSGVGLSSGVYLCRMETHDFMQSQRIVLLK